MPDLYIYYRVRDDQAALLAPRVRAMQTRLAAGQFKRRPGSSDGQQTWMEIYQDADLAFEAALAAAVQQAGLLEFTQGARHTEIFTDVETCA